MNLVLVESPTKARMLSKFLGSGYQVEATMGHICDLPQKKFGVDIKVNGQAKIIPDYEISEGKAQRVANLKSLSQKTEKIILATDPDREGEAIAWHAAALLRGENLKFSRVVFHQITQDAILEAILIYSKFMILRQQILLVHQTKNRNIYTMNFIVAAKSLRQ